MLIGDPGSAQGQRVRVLVVDDDPIAAESLAEFLHAEGYDTATAFNAEEALSALGAADGMHAGGTKPGAPRVGNGAGGDERAGRAAPFSVVVSDVAMPGMGGIELLRRVGKEHPGVVVIMLTGYGTIESAVVAVRLGAVDYLTKPVVDSELRLAMERAVRQQALVAENAVLRSQLDDRYSLDSIVGSDHRMLKIYDLIGAVAPSKTTVLMTGESGTGKSLVAHAIHRRSPRQSKPFVEISCGSIPETLLESELFGHAKGAFTGAYVDKVGKFLAADGGTIFLDEINSASPAMQLKLLRVLQERRFEAVGSTRTIDVDVRVVLASNQPLERLVAEGQFRQDLYYRINVVKIELPPLRDRISDIPLLAEHFLRKHGAELGKQFAGFTPAAMDLLRRYAYPGNIRELANIVERAAVLSRGQTIVPDDLPPQLLDDQPPGILHRIGPAAPGDTAADPDHWVPVPLEEALREPERRILLIALKANGWNRQKTAEQLSINRTTLYKKMKQLGIEPQDGTLAG